MENILSQQNINVSGNLIGNTKIDRHDIYYITNIIISDENKDLQKQISNKAKERGQKSIKQLFEGGGNDVSFIDEDIRSVESEINLLMKKWADSYENIKHNINELSDDEKIAKCRQGLFKPNKYVELIPIRNLIAKLISNGELTISIQIIEDCFWYWIYNRFAKYDVGNSLFDQILNKNSEFIKLTDSYKAIVFMRKALCLSRLGQPQKAIELLYKATKIYSNAPEKSGRKGELLAYRHIIDDLLFLGNFSDAEIHLKWGINIAKKENRLKELALYRRQYGRLLGIKGNYEEGRKQLNKSFEYFKQVNDWDDFREVRISVIYKAFLELKSNNALKALKLGQIALKSNEFLRDDRDKLRINILLGSCFRKLEDFRQSEIFFDEAFKTQDEINSSIDYKVDLLLEYAKLKKFINNRSNANELYLALQIAIPAGYATKIAEIISLKYINPSSTESIIKLISYSTLNLIFKVDLNNKNRSYVIKMYREPDTFGTFQGKERLKEVRMNKEIQLLQYLNAINFSAPKFCHEITEYHMIIREYIEGENLLSYLPKIPLDKKLEIMHEVGKWLAKFHHLHPKVDFPKSDIYLYDEKHIWPCMLDYAKKQKKYDLIQSLESNEYFFSKKSTIKKNILIWGSCSVDNIYWNEYDEQIIGNDFEFCFYGDGLYDLGRFASSLFQHFDDEVNILIEALSKSYETNADCEVSNLIYFWAIAAICINTVWGNISVKDRDRIVPRILKRLK